MIEPGLTVRRARTVALVFEGPQLVAHNFLSRTTAALSPAAVAVLANAADWLSVPALSDLLGRAFGLPDPTGEIEALLAARLLVSAGSEAAERDAEYESDWEWGLITGLYHFGSKNQEYMPPEAVPLFLQERMATSAPTELHRSNAGYEAVVGLEPPNGNGVLDLMRRRRSYRGFDTGASIELGDLRDCLFAGLGITGFARVPFEDEELPLKMTPSGGGRNPYEGYVIARHVEDLPPGVYHYSGAENSLGLVNDAALPEFHELLGGQTWMDGAAVLILLVANLRRTMRKYAFPTAYRVVLVEAGHIAQNIVLAATERGLASVPTCAIADAAVEAMLGTDGLLQSVTYAVAVGRRTKPSSVDLKRVRPNPAAG